MLLEYYCYSKDDSYGNVSFVDSTKFMCHYQFYQGRCVISNDFCDRTDVNQDHKVDLLDLVAVSRNWGKICGI